MICLLEEEGGKEQKKMISIIRTLTMCRARTCTILSLKAKARLRELAPVARGSRDAVAHNLVFTF